MGISQAALSYLGQFNKRNNLSVNLPHVGEFWVGMSVFDIKSQLDQADRKCYLKRKTESTYTLCDTFDQELLILGIRSMVETITCKDMENYLNADVKAFGAYAVNGASTLLSSNTLKRGGGGFPKRGKCRCLRIRTI